MILRAAVYARYSSDNQRPTSIEDQVSACRRYADQEGIVVLEDHIYHDRAQPGTRRDRQGLSALNEAASQKCFDRVLVDDLSRMTRDLVFMLDLVRRFRFLNIGVISVADGINTLDEKAILHLQLCGVINENHSRDLGHKTRRGQLGQKARGFSAGDIVFGYRSVPSGPFSRDKSGRSRPLGYKPEIDPVQAGVVHRIFRDFADGQAQTRIMRALNEEGVLGRSARPSCWSPSTISRMLRNEKYIGHWVWNKTRTLTDLHTGRQHPVPKPPSEWSVTDDESLRIIDPDLWDAVQRRREEVGRNYAASGRRGFSRDQRSRVQTSPPHLLSGAMVCASCGGVIGLVGGKGDGYYGCLAHRRGACEIEVVVPRRRAEDRILDSLRGRLLHPEPLHHLLQRVEEEANTLYDDIPAAIALKRKELKEAKRRQANFVAFVARGEAVKAVVDALAALEPQVEALEHHVASLERARAKRLRAPSLPWLCQQLSCLRSVLESRTQKSALLLRRILCPIRLDVVKPSGARPYFVARTALDTLALLDDPESGDSPDSGSKSLQWWTGGGLRPAVVVRAADRPQRR